MAYAVADYRTVMGALLGTALDSATWTTTVLDAGLSQALLHVSEHVPPTEETIVCVDGRDQDISDVAGLLSIAAVGWPWDDEEQVFRSVRWRLRDWVTLHIESGVPAAGDGLRLRYWKQLTINGLMSATVTTVPDTLLQAVSSGAAGYALLTRLRQVGEAAAPPPDTQKAYTQLAGQWIEEMARALQQVSASRADPAWSEIGL